MQKTQRTYTDAETGIMYALYKDSADRFRLILDTPQGPQAPTPGTEVNGFYLCAFTACTIKINKTKQVRLNMGQFYTLKEGEQVTHCKYIGFDKFTKV
jgi:hypothetical protein